MPSPLPSERDSPPVLSNLWQRRLARAKTWAWLAEMGVLIAVVAISVGGVIAVKTYVSTRPQHDWLMRLALGASFASIIGFLLLHGRLHIALMRRFKACCPQCRLILDDISAAHVDATGICRHCSQVIDAELHEQSRRRHAEQLQRLAGGLVEPLSWTERFHACRSSPASPGWFIVAGLAGVTLAPVIAASMGIARNYRSMVVITSFWACILGGLVAYVFVERMRGRRLERNGLFCPTCLRYFDEASARHADEKGNCRVCGAAILPLEAISEFPDAETASPEQDSITTTNVNPYAAPQALPGVDRNIRAPGKLQPPPPIELAPTTLSPIIVATFLVGCAPFAVGFILLSMLRTSRTQLWREAGVSVEKFPDKQALAAAQRLVLQRYRRTLLIFVGMVLAGCLVGLAAASFMSGFPPSFPSAATWTYGAIALLVLAGQGWLWLQNRRKKPSVDLAAK